MAWKNKNTMNVSSKGLWKEDVFDVNIVDELKTKDNFTVHMRQDVLERKMPKEDAVKAAKVPMAVDKRFKNTVTIPENALVSIGVYLDKTMSQVVAESLDVSKVHVHWYGPDSVHGTYDILDHGNAVDNAFEYVRGNDGLDRETESSLNDDRYHRSCITLSGPMSVLRPSIADKTTQSSSTLKVPLPLSVSETGYGQLLVPSENVIYDDTDNVHVKLGDQLLEYNVRVEEDLTSMKAADIAHNVKRMAGLQKLPYQVSMPTTSMMMRESPLSEFEDVLSSSQEYDFV